MKYTKNVKWLGLSKKDFKIINNLALVKKSKILPLANSLCLPRTSVAFRLKKMEKRGFMERKKIKGHFEWQLTAYAKNIFLENKGKEELRMVSYNNKKDIESIFLSILKDKSKERLYFIEPYTQTKEFVEKIESRTMKNIAKVFQKEKNISEGVSSEKNIELIKKYDKRVLESMLGRATIIYVIPDKYISFDEMIFVYKNSVYTFDFKKWQALKIENKSFAKVMSSMIAALQNFGSKIDLNELIRGTLKKYKDKAYI